MKKLKRLSTGFSILLLLILVLTGCGPGIAQIGGASLIQKAAVTPAASDNTALKDFTSSDDLVQWLNNSPVLKLPPVDNVTDWFNKARMIQAEALADGYVINIDYDYYVTDDTYKIYCTAVIDDKVYFWDPESNNITMDHGLSGIKQYFK